MQKGRNPPAFPLSNLHTGLEAISIAMPARISVARLVTHKGYAAMATAALHANNQLVTTFASANHNKISVDAFDFRMAKPKAHGLVYGFSWTAYVSVMAVPVRIAVDTVSRLFHFDNSTMIVLLAMHAIILNAVVPPWDQARTAILC